MRRPAPFLPVLPTPAARRAILRVALAALAVAALPGCSAQEPGPPAVSAEAPAPPAADESAAPPREATSPARAAPGFGVAAAADPPPRGLWVLCEGSQRVLESPERVATLLDDARALGVTDLFVQVYRGGRAWFDSSHADRAPYEATYRREGRDALKDLIARAQAAGLRVHAWVNVLSLAGHTDVPILRTLGRDAVQVDQKGRSVLDYPDRDLPMPDRAWYRMGTPAVWLDPAAPGVADYLQATFVELVERYPALDGLHLDYVRYADVLPYTPGTRFGVGLSFGFGEASRARFRRETGLEAPFGDSLAHGDRFDDWRRAKLTELVAGIASQTRIARPGLELSAAAIADRERAYLVDFQDWVGWLDAGHLDFAVPMLYSRDHALVRQGTQALAGLGRHRAIWVGLGSWLFASQPEGALRQLGYVEDEPLLGSALFSWDSIRETPALRTALARGTAGGDGTR